MGFKILGIGEILWDFLPTGKQLGGAPANFAYISQQLGNKGFVVSKIGNDVFGNEILSQLANKNLTTKYLKIDQTKATGIVKIILKNGEPSYEIVENVAWDFLELNENWKNLAKSADAVCFGSLAQRNAVSLKTIRDFLSLTNYNCLRIFDVNLRQKYFNEEILRQSFILANVCKLNHEELPIVAELFEIKDDSIIGTAKNLQQKFDLKLLCVTRGSNGSMLISENETSEFGGIKIDVADTIGAGDAFTAAMTHGLLRGWELAKVNVFANQVGAFVASKTGAMPDFSEFK
jgi:fructokinase